MTEQEKQKLNEKLAKWAGFMEIHDIQTGAIFGDRLWTPNRVYWDEDRKWVWKNKLNFTDSLDACFKWLVPKLDYYCLTPEYDGRGYYADASIGNAYAEYFQGETQPLAFCLAIEKLIDTQSEYKDAKAD